MTNAHLQHWIHSNIHILSFFAKCVRSPQTLPQNSTNPLPKATKVKHNPIEAYVCYHPPPTFNSFKSTTMMKSALVALVALFSAISANAMEISANSALGMDLVSKARRLENDDDNNAFSATWVSGYAVKFQGCHHIKQWNGDADDESDVKISTTRLIRFRLCPESSCSSTKAAGCAKGYGDYIVDMDTFMNSYIEAKKQESEYNCEAAITACGCGDDDGSDYCEYDCYVAADMTECVENNPYEEDGDGNQQDFDLEEYMQCAQLNVNNNNNGGDGRKLDENAVSYYVGPYCAKQGGSVYMGLFTDDTCTEFATVTFESLTGFELPYDGKSMISDKCLSCLEKNNDDNDNDQADADQVSETCETIYTSAGKCESSLSTDYVAYPNNNACTYMEGVRVVRQDGIVDTGSARSSAVATSFIVIFAMAFSAMAFYTWYLRTRLGVKQNSLL
jgi:hypothetical protein